MQKIVFYYTVVFFLFIVNIMNAQKYDYSWHFGNNGMIDYGYELNFQGDTVSIVDSIFRDIVFNHTTGSIADSNGALQFYTNGCKVFNHVHELMENGESMGGGDEFYAQVCRPSSGMRWEQGILILPIDDGRYQMFHQNAMRDDVTGGPYADVVYRSVIDMNANNGLGRVVEKNIEILNDTILTGNFAAVQHANGVDWWLIFHQTNSDGFYILHVDNEGVVSQKMQHIGVPTSRENETIGQAKFTPDGKKFIHYDLITGMQIFDFNRGTGSLSNPIHIPLWRTLSTGFKIGGMGISSNSRYVYACNRTHLDQFDLWAADIKSSQVLVDTFDGYANPLPLFFFQMQLAPDDKIYMCFSNSEEFMHVIHQPNLRGDSCQFEQRGLVLPEQNNFSMPYFPNYRLGADSSLLVSVKTPLADDRQIDVYPNPTLDVLRVDLPLLSLKSYMIFDISGRTVVSETNFHSAEVDVKTLHAGLYYLQIESKDGSKSVVLFFKL